MKITIWAKRYYPLCFDYQCSYQHSIRFVLVFCWPFFLKQMVKWCTTVSTLLLFPEIHYYITELMQFFRQKMSQVLRYGNFQSFFIHKTLLHQKENPHKNRPLIWISGLKNLIDKIKKPSHFGNTTQPSKIMFVMFFGKGSKEPV